MNVTNIKSYRDGGTIEIVLDNGSAYFINGKIASSTVGCLFDHYPSDESFGIQQCQLVYKALLGALERFYEGGMEGGYQCITTQCAIRKLKELVESK
jgi:hypothetical protein